MSRSRLLLFIILLLWIPARADNGGPTIDGSGSTVLVQSKQIWAQSYLWAKAPDLAVEKWITHQPETKEKFLLIEFWATWCSACRRAQPLMNAIQEKYGHEMVIIGISDEAGEKVADYCQANSVQYSVAIDTQARMKDQLGIWGIPHVVIVEPGGYVIWEGFPLLKGYELTEETVGKILEIGRRQESKMK